MKNIALLQWLKTANDEQIAETNTTRGYLRQIAYGNKSASPEIAVRLELATDSLVTRKQLRPHDWIVIWPELAA
jgi:DNA-binding transcriptional regulator YdaS (Cro superfamily)